MKILSVETFIFLAAILICGSSHLLGQQPSDGLSTEELRKLQLLRSSYVLEMLNLNDQFLDKPIRKLRTGYQKRLKELQSKFTKAGELSKAVVARDAAKTDPTPDKIIEKIQEIALAQKIFLAKQEEILMRRNDDLLKVSKSYVTKLTAIKNKLAKANRLEAAVAVSQDIEEILTESEGRSVDQKAKTAAALTSGKNQAVFRLYSTDSRDFRKHNFKRKNLKKYMERSGDSYLGPAANGTDAELVLKFQRHSSYSRAQLTTKCLLWDFTKEGGGIGRGMANIEGSSDGKEWFVLRDGMTQKDWGKKDFSFDGELPENILEGSHVYIRIRLHTENAPENGYTVAQFGRTSKGEENPPPFFELIFSE